MSRILITGSNGFIGRHTLTPLVRSGHDLVLTDLDAASVNSLPDCARYVSCNLGNENRVREILFRERPEYLLHLAWYTEHGRFWSAPENMACVRDSLKLVESFKAAGGKRVVMAGTCAEYEWADQICREYHTPLIPSTFYGTCKNSLNQICTKYCSVNEMSCAWGRVFFMYGPDENLSRFVPYVITSLLQGKQTRCTHCRQIRDFMHVSDTACAFAALLLSTVEGDVNLCSGNAVPLREIVDSIGEETGGMKWIQYGAIPLSDHEPMCIAGENNRLKKEVGYKPVWDLKKGIQDVVTWWKKNLDPQ